MELSKINRYEELPVEVQEAITDLPVDINVPPQFLEVPHLGAEYRPRGGEEWSGLILRPFQPRTAYKVREFDSEVYDVIFAPEVPGENKVYLRVRDKQRKLAFILASQH